MFLTLGLQFQAWNLKISFQNKKNTDSGASISGLEPWNFIPKLKKTYILQCKMTLGLQFHVWNLEIYSKLEKTYILQCKMYVFDSGASISGLEHWKFIPKIEKDIHFTV